MPNALAVGVSYETFMRLTPKKLTVFYKAYRIKMQLRDEEMWRNGMYTFSAFSTVIANSFSKTAKAEYLKHPLLEGVKQKEEISEEKRIEMENHKTAMTLKIMQVNFELAKNRNKLEE